MRWRMVDEDVAYLSPSTVYRILKEADLVCPWRRRAKRKKALEEKATRPDQRWSTDLTSIQVENRVYYFVGFPDDYSQYIVHHELLLGMDSLTVSLAARKGIETLPKGHDGQPVVTPEIRSDNGGCYISKEFRVVLRVNGLGHHRIKPHCPEEKGYTSSCTSFVFSEEALGNCRGSVRFRPCLLTGRFVLTGSYRYSGLLW
jgi:transposase InsO family protein